MAEAALGSGALTADPCSDEMVLLKTGVLWLRENPTTSTAEPDGVTMTVARHGLSKWVPVVMFCQRFRSQRAGRRDHIPGPGLGGAAGRRLTIPMHADQRLS